MKILIVNGYSKDYKGRRRFEEFVRIIKELYIEQRISLADQPEIIVRDKDNLEDYLYEAYTQYSNVESRKRFDVLDFVFIDGDGNQLPWQKKN